MLSVLKLRAAQRRIIDNPKYERKPFLLCVSPIKPTTGISVRSVDISNAVKNRVTIIIRINS